MADPTAVRQSSWAKDDEFEPRIVQTAGSGGQVPHTVAFHRKRHWRPDILGTIVGPNWVAVSDWRVTPRAVHEAIGGELVMVDSTASPAFARTSVPFRFGSDEAKLLNWICRLALRIRMRRPTQPSRPYSGHV